MLFRFLSLPCGAILNSSLALSNEHIRLILWHFNYLVIPCFSVPRSIFFKPQFAQTSKRGIVWLRNFYVFFRFQIFLPWFRFYFKKDIRLFLVSKQFRSELFRFPLKPDSLECFLNLITSCVHYGHPHIHTAYPFSPTLLEMLLLLCAFERSNYLLL